MITVLKGDRQIMVRNRIRSIQRSGHGFGGCVAVFAVCVSMLFSCFAVPVQAQTAQYLYSTYQDRIYQIRLIELASGSKASIGSGFQVAADGLIATNYHVISGAVYDPEKYRMEFIDHEGNSGALELVDIDVIHDLALVKHKESARQTFLKLSAQAMIQGQDVFSIGNPRDLGMTVVKGTYNGLLEHSYYNRILFSGSINPGMSGGPALNDRGEVIGINVATAGNQLSFLVPVAQLAHLMERQGADGQAKKSYKETIHEQLLLNQERQIKTLLDTEWPTIRIGDAIVAGEMTHFTRCWGGSNDKERDRLENPAKYSLFYTQCFSEDKLFLTDNLATGIVNYEFYWLDSDELNIWQFYSRYQESFGGASPVNKTSEEHVSNFTCHNDFVGSKNPSGKPKQIVWKTVVCARQYKDYPKIYDLMFIAAAVGEGKKGLISHFAISGIDKPLGLQFVKKFLEHVQWKSS